MGGVPEVGYPHQGTPVGVPPWPGPMGVPPARPDRGYPRWGTPPPGLMGGTQGGVPPARSNGGVPKVGYPPVGVPSLPGPSRGTPLPTWTCPGYPPPPRCGQTESSPDRHVSKHNLPSYYVRGR